MSFRALASALVVSVVAGLAFAGPATTAPQARLVIEGIGLDVRLARRLSEGPVAYYRDRDTIAVAGHRTTYSHPFRELPRLRRGDRIRLGGRVYEVRRKAIVRPRATWVLNYRGLVLSACHPAGSDRFRYVVFAAELSR
ncbi:MAG: class E sortase [Thermoleophilia bacterium]|nr:class E sortase [Thermoleophilia bacterium]